MTSRSMTLSFLSVTRRLLLLPRSTKRLIMVLADSVMVPLALWSAVALKQESWTPSVVGLPTLLAVSLIVTIPVFIRLGLYRAIVRFLGPRALYAVVAGVTISAAILAVYTAAIDEVGIGGSDLFIYWTLALLYAGGSRLIVRQLFNVQAGRGAERVLIYGAGDAGARLCTALLGGIECQPIAFIDGKRALQGSYINGLEVLPPAELSAVIREREITGILLALPSASRRRKREILHELEPLGVHVRSLPQMSDIVSGKARMDEIEEVDVADLLGRDAVPPNPRLLDACVRGKVVMVTGAGGSIGSELCRQMLKLRPRQLVLFEMSEIALYTIDSELRAVIKQSGLQVELVSLLGNAHHQDRVKDVLITYRVQTLYHAAAYKHVPIVEQNVVEGVHNNVVATWYTAEAALQAGVETFVLVSTDKAVNPTNVMGATKRAAEIVLQALHERSQKTRFCMVRFGNVLASSGSVVPLFQRQIRGGGPITVTHPDVTRYFMTIPEAAALVIQAGSMAKGGDVFVLDMGKPVRINELARRMVHLMGLSVCDAANPDGDIEIAYSGLRPGEKLFEELLIGNNVSGTDHPMIMRAMEHYLPWSQVEGLLGELLVALRDFDCAAVVRLLRATVAEYRPTEHVHDLVWTNQQPTGPADRKVTPLPQRKGSRQQSAN